MRIIKAKPKNPGDGRNLEKEELQDVKFNVHKFTNRPKPSDPRRVVIISCFAEFGCETIGVLYCIPRLLREHPGAYKIAMGWYGRSYFYRHLVDEFWEIKEEHQWLREYCRAFHHDSKNLKALEAGVTKFGTVFPTTHLGRYAIANRCNRCQAHWGGAQTKDLHLKSCPKCGSEDAYMSLFSDVKKAKHEAVRLPPPSREKLEEADALLGPNPVGVFARGRKCYGRNLQPEFYAELVYLLRNMGYSPIWLGEKVTTQPCPVSDVVDLSRSEKARDLELTMAIISRCRFTVQYWTASTRLAGMLGIPYLLFESPDQIWGNGQEGYRRNLADFGPSKLAVCHFRNVYEDNDRGIVVTKQCIQEMERGNYEDVFGMLDTRGVAQMMKQNNRNRIGG